MDPLNDELVLEDAQGGVLFGQPSPSAAGGDGGHRIPRLSPNLLLDPTTIPPAVQSHHQRRHSSVCSAFAPPPRRSAENNFLSLASKATAIATALGDPNTLQNTAWHGGSSFLGTGGSSLMDSSSSASGGPSSLHAAERRLSALQDHYTATLSSTTTASVLAKSNTNSNSNGVNNNNSSNGAAAFDDRSKSSLQVVSNARNHSKLVLSELSAAPSTQGSHGSPVPGEAVVVRLLHIPPECRGEKSISVLQRMVSRLVQLPYLSNGGDGSLAATVPPPPMTPGSATMAAAVTPSGSSLPLELTFLSSMDDGFGGTLDLPSNKSASGESVLFPLGGNAAPPSTDTVVPLTLPVLSVTVGAAAPPSMSPSGDSGAAVIAIAQPFISKGNILQRYEEWAEPHGKVEREMVIRSILQSLLEGLVKFHRAGMAHGSVKLTNVFSLMDVTESIDTLHGLFVGNGGGGLLQDDATREQQGLHAASRMQSFQNGHGRGERRRSNAGKTGPLLHGTLWAQQVLLVDGGLYERCEELFLQLDGSSGSSSAFQQSSSFFSPTAKEDSVVPAAGSPLARSNAHELRYFSIATREYVPGPEVVQWTDQQQQQQEEEGTSPRPDAAKDASRIVHAVLDANLTSTSRCRTFLSKALDIWDVGLCAIQLADGGFPSWLRRQKMPVPSLRRGWWSRRFASFVESCLNVDPLKRPTVEELLADPWFQAPLLSPAPSSTVVSREASNPLRALLPMYGAHLPDGAVATHLGEERSGFLPTLDSTLPPAAAPRVYLRSMVDLMRTFQVAVLEKQFPATPLSSGRNAVSASVRRRSLEPSAVVVSGGPPMVPHHGGGGHSPRAALDVGQRLSSTHTAVPSLLSTLTLRDVDLTAALQPIAGDGERQSPPPLATAAAVDEPSSNDEGDDAQPHQEEGEEAAKDSEPTTSLRLPRRRPCFVGGLAVAVDTTRRLILSASGLFAREDGIVVTIDPTTGEEHPLTPSQEAVVASIDSKCSALIGAMTDLASRSSLSADAWCASLLQHMARHSQWRPLVEPVVAEAGLGGSALSSQLSVAQARPDAANNKAMGGAAPPSLSSSLQEEDATPTQYNNFLFSKWHYSSRALLAEQQAK